MKRISLLLSAALVITGLSACVEVDYTGEKFKPVTRIKVFDNAKEVPLNEYYVIGRASGVALEGYTIPEIKEKLLEKGKEVGAEAVAFGYGRISRITPRPEMADQTPGSLDPEGNWGFGSAPDGSPIRTNCFGDYVPNEQKAQFSYKTTVHAVYFRKRTGK